MNLESPNVSYAVQLRQSHPEKMGELEQMVRTFFDKVKMEGENLSDKSVALVANAVANRLQRKTVEGATMDELNKTIEDTLYEGIDVRLKLKEQGFERPTE